MSIVTCFWDVSNPFLWLIATFFLYSEISYTQPTTCEHGHLEFHCYWRFLPSFFIFGRNEIGNSSQYVFLISLELLDPPHYARFVWLIFAFSDSRPINFNISSVRWYRNFHNNIVGKVWMFKNGSKLHRILNPIVIGKFLDDWSYFEGDVDARWNSVGHHLEKPIWWDESDGSVPIEPSQSDTLMELDIVDLNSFLLLLSLFCGIWVIPY